MTDPLRATLDQLGLGDFYDLLAANDVDASGIDELTEADLRELGLTLGQRKRFMRARAAPADFPRLDNAWAPRMDWRRWESAGN